MHIRRAFGGLLLLALSGCGRSELLGLGTAKTCRGDQVACATGCVDLLVSRSHCGSCDVACSSDEECLAGSCQTSCASGQTLCDGRCTDTLSDVEHCGTCSNACFQATPNPVSCEAGICTESCALGLQRCAGLCVDLTNDQQHCGRCDASCAPGMTCVAGACTGCQFGQTLCDGFCTDLSSNVDYCGDCDVMCPFVVNATRLCVAGSCTVRCDAEKALCGADCVDLSTDPTNCGNCGVACQALEFCSMGNCQADCAVGEALCGGECVDLQIDVRHCGDCNLACEQVPNATSSCHLGQCARACDPGFDDCDGDLDAVPSNGCEAPASLECRFKIERVSVATDGAEGIGPSLAPALSADGQLVAFYSLAPNLSVEITDTPNLLVRDRKLRTTTWLGFNPVLTSTPGLSADGALAVFTRESVSSWERTVILLSTADRVSRELLPVNGSNSYFPSISSSGNRVVFDSFDASLGPQALVYATVTEAIEPLATAGTLTAGGAAISGDGRFVVVQLSVDGRAELELLDTRDAVTTRVTRGLENAPPNGNSDTPAISADGTVIAFASAASNLVTNDLNGVTDVFVFTVASGDLRRISFDALGEVRGASQMPSVSGDGRFVAFESLADNLVPEDTNNASDIFVYDRVSEQVSRVSLSYLQQQASGPSAAARISNDGNFVCFQSTAEDLVLGDNNAVGDVFCAERSLGR